MPRVPILLLVCLLALPCLGCESILPDIEQPEDARFSPIPPRVALGPGGYRPPPRPAALDQNNSESLDELLAIVEGKYLNRRQLHRRLAMPDQFVPERGREEESRREYNAEIERETLKWAREQIFIKASERIGLKLPPARIDELVERQLDRQLKAASEEAGREVTREEWLASKDMSFPEYREQMRGTILGQVYRERLFFGIGGQLRPTVDLEVTPAEVRRVYRNNAENFDQPAGVKFAMYRVDYDLFENEQRSFLEIEELANKTAAQVRRDAAAGLPPEEIARRNQLGESGPTTWISYDQFRGRPAAGGDPELFGWMYDPSRKAGDTWLVSNDPGGPLIFHIRDTRPAQKRSFEDSYEEIVRFIREARQMRLESEEMIRLLDKGGTVWPETLADKLMEQSQQVLVELRRTPTLQGVRLR